MPVRKFVFFLIYLSIFLICSNLIAQEVKIITFDYPPIMGASKLSQEGIEVEILKGALKSAGLNNSSVAFYPRPRAKQEFLANDSALYIGSLSFFDAPTQAKLDAFPMCTIRLLLFYLKENFTDFSWKEYSDLKKYTVGVSASGVAFALGQQHNLKIDPTNELDALFRKLESKRNDFIVAMDLSGWLKIDELFPGEKKRFTADTKKAFSVANGEVIIFKSNPINAKVKAGLRAFYRSGEWLKLMEKFYGKGNTPNDAINLMENFYK